jgi:hypothetical protein
MDENAIRYVQMDIFNTMGLTSIQQAVDITPNDLFSIERDTSDAATMQGIVFPSNINPFLGELRLMPMNPPHRKDGGHPPNGIMPLALVIGTCKGIPKESQP